MIAEYPADEPLVSAYQGHSTLENRNHASEAEAESAIEETAASPKAHRL